MAVISDFIGTLRTAFKVAKATLDSAGLTAAHTFKLPDRGGTLACDMTNVLSVHPAGAFAGGEVWFGIIGSASSSSSSFGMTAATIYGWPWYCPEDMTVDRMGIRITTAIASSHIRLGIYHADTAKYPSSLVIDAGEVDTSSTGMKTATISQALKGSTLYYLAIVSDINPSVRALATSSAIPFLGVDNTIGAFQAGITNAQTYGALPSTFPSSAPAMTSNEAYAVMRRSA